MIQHRIPGSQYIHIILINVLYCKGYVGDQNKVLNAVYYCLLNGVLFQCVASNKKGCGLGDRRRQVRCQHASCAGEPPPHSEPCSAPCAGVVWNYGEWGRVSPFVTPSPRTGSRVLLCLQCTRPCGGGWRHRLVRCQAAQGTFLEEEACPEEDKPSTRQECNTHRCHGYRWKTGPWGQVSASNQWNVASVS